MKTTILSAIILLTAVTTQAVEPDTIMSVKNPHIITVIENASGIKVTVEGTSADSTFQTTYSKKYDDRTLVKSSAGQKPYLRLSPCGNSKIFWDVEMGGLCFGFVDAANTSAFEPEMGKSFEISFLEALNVGYNNHNTRISAGIGFGWRNWRMTKDTRFIATDGFITAGPYPGGALPRYSRIKMFSLSFPVMITQKMPFKAPWGRMSLKAGVILNWNSHASMKTSWTDAESIRIEQSADNIKQRKFTTDLFGAVGINSWLGIYVRYSLQPVFKNGYGPEFNAFSTGITIGI